MEIAAQEIVNRIDAPMIFKANDIRGIVDEQLTEKLAYWVGRSFGSKMIEQGLKEVVVGRDGRLSGPSLKEALIKGLSECGVKIYDIGLVPSPVLYFSTYALNTGTGIMITGSHNPKNYNGFKMMMGGQTLSHGQIQDIKTRIEVADFVPSQPSLVVPVQMLDAYKEAILKDVCLTRPLKVVVDCGHGAAAVNVVDVIEGLGAQVIELYCTVDGNFPAHHPDPSVPGNMQDLITAVKTHKADIGVAFDGDGDRLGVVTPKGEIIWPDRQLMLFSEQVLQAHPNANIIYDVKCTSHLKPWIESRGGNAIMAKTGHALIKQEMQTHQAPLAGEMSGHFFFKDRWYGFDDATYACARMLQIISNKKAPFDSLPDSVNTPEIQIPIQDELKFRFIERFIDANPFKDAILIFVDGLRVEFDYGWGLIRASNTSPNLVLRFEATDEQGLLKTQEAFKSVIHALEPNLKVPF